jgi:hypothetical protein
MVWIGSGAKCCLPTDFGQRHRAGAGLERCPDAVLVRQQQISPFGFTQGAE